MLFSKITCENCSFFYLTEPVHFETTSTNQTTRLGHSVTLECQPLGDDPIRVTWTLEGNVLDFRNQR